MTGQAWEDPGQFSSWDTVIIGTHTFPGIARATLTSGGERDVEVLKAKGNDGAEAEDNGYVPAAFDITIKYHSNDHDTIRSIVEDLHPRTNGIDRGPQGVDFEQLNFLGVDQVQIINISPPIIGTDRFGQVVISVLEFTQPKKRPKKKAAVGVGISPEERFVNFETYSGGLIGVDAIEAGFQSTEGLV